MRRSYSRHSPYLLLLTLLPVCPPDSASLCILQPIFCWQGVTARVQGLIADEHPYDLGTYHNLHQVLGESVGMWLCPPLAPTPGGTSFVTVWTMERHGLS